MIGVIALTFVMPTATFAEEPEHDVGDYGNWLTENNKNKINAKSKQDLKNFSINFDKNFTRTRINENYVPVEAKIGVAFMNAMSSMGKILDNSLGRFAIIFIIVAYAFWVFFEAYNLITGNSNTKKTAEAIVKKGALISVWLLILNMGVARIFMMIMGPVLDLGSYISRMILNAISSTVNTNLPDTCAAIKVYASQNIPTDLIIDPEFAASILCIPVQMTTFLYSGIYVGLDWMISINPFSIFLGAVFVVLFIYNIWKFALVAIGVIADLFLGVFMLPFTAITETVGKTSYKGLAGEIFNGFLGLFKTENLQTQIQRFINATLYFISLSIVVAVCAALFSSTVDFNALNDSPSVSDAGFLTCLLVSFLTLYLLRKSSEIAAGIGGKIDYELGTRIGQDTNKLWKIGSGWAKKGWTKWVKKK